jgi:hypothetical protein
MLLRSLSAAAQSVFSISFISLFSKVEDDILYIFLILS